MMAFYVGDFVAENAGQLVGAFRAFDQTSVDVNRAARHSKSIELRILDYEEAIVEGLRPGGRNDGILPSKAP